MNDQLTRIEQACIEAGGLPVIATGGAMFLIGLFLWLGGLRYLKAVTGFIGAGIGVGIGFALTSYIDIHPVAIICISATVFAFAAMLAQQLIILTLAIIIFSFAFGTGYLDYAIDKHGLSEPALHNNEFGSDYPDASSPTNDDIYNSSNPFNELQPMVDKLEELEKAGKTAVKAGKYAEGFWDKIKSIFNDLKPTLSNNAGYLILWCVVGGIIGLVLAQLLKLLVMAFCCSIVGSSAMIAGLMIAITAKGTPVWSNLENHHQVLTIVFAVMIVFGWIFQLLTRGQSKSAAKNNDSDESKE